MITKSLLIGFLGLLTINSGLLQAYGEKSLFIGSIHFPNTLEMVPNVRIYYAGRKIVAEIDDFGKKITFSIPEFKQRTFFYLLVTSDIEFCSHENTVPYLKLKRQCPYRFFAMELVQMPVQKNNKTKRLGANPSEKYTPEYAWNVKELNLALPNGRIPDETIIVRYNPDYIQSLEGGNVIEFPKIVMKSNIIELAGSQAKLHEMSNKWFLASLHTDTIHETTQSEIKMNHAAKTVIAMTA